MNAREQIGGLGLLDGLGQVLGRPDGMFALHEPEFSGNEWALVKDTLDTTFVSSVGRYVDRFEQMLADFTGAKHAVAVSNGTSALQVAMVLAGVGHDDEVLIPALSFVATANAVAHAGAIPHFVDSALDTMGLDPVALRAHLAGIAEKTGDGARNRLTGRRIAAIVPMHTYGHPVDLASLMDIAGEYGLPVVEDAAESLGSTYQGHYTGTFGLLGTLSFNGNKIVTTGGGGAILTNDAELARRAKHLTTTAKRPHRWEFQHDEVAWNFRLPNLNAALGCAQLERLPDFIRRKRALADRYKAAFAGSSQLRFMREPDGTTSNYWLCTVALNSPDMATRDRLLGQANDAGYQCRPTWTLLHRLPMYAAAPRAPLPVAEVLEASLINIPSSAKLGSAA
jgi:perosamine synthetase